MVDIYSFLLNKNASFIYKKAEGVWVKWNGKQYTIYKSLGQDEMMG